MSAELNTFYQQLLERNDFRLVTILSDKSQSGVFVVSVPNSKDLFILKVNKLTPAKLQREVGFLKAASNRSFDFLKLPKVIRDGNNWMLMEKLQLTTYSRDSILEKKWSDDEVSKWVHALKEFQHLPQQSDRFTLKEKLKGYFYPLLRLFQIRKDLLKYLNKSQLFSLGLMAMGYLLKRPFHSSVTTHYDFNTTNFTEEVGTGKMCMIDFEAGAYKGDANYDLLYYLSIPTVSLKDWTFQRLILKKWFDQQGEHMSFSKSRIRFLMILMHFQRILRFRDDKAKAKVYLNDLPFLFDKTQFYPWLREVVFGR